MKKDIKNRGDIELLVNNFYERVKADDMIAHIFTDVVKVDWSRHLPVMYQFWENVLFFTGGYEGNPLEAHRRLDKIIPLTSQYFERWLYLFTTVTDELFEGEKATLAKQRAKSIAVVMQTKITV